ncbi:MAG TPA: hypothetical protein VGM83_13720 [Devosiaceae bacterium]|jgi:sugar lactone lactonase YvrE
MSAVSPQDTGRRIVGSGDYQYEFIPNWGSFPDKLYNNGIAVDSRDRVYVVSLGLGTYKNLTRSQLIYVADHDGNMVDAWGEGNSDHAHGLNIVDDILYFTDKYASICLKYTLDGKPLQIFGKRGMHSDTGCYKSGDPVPRAAGPFNRPDDMTRSPWGDLYVADGTHNARVHRFDSAGNLIQSWGVWGHGKGEFSSPHAVLPMADRRVYVCDRMNHRIQIFTAEGQFLESWDSDLQWPSKIVPTLEGDFAVAEDPGNQIARGDSEDRSEAKAARPSGIRILDKHGKLITHLDTGKTHQMTIDSRGDIYTATHTSVNKLVRLNGPERRQPTYATIYGEAPFV